MRSCNNCLILSLRFCTVFWYSLRRCMCVTWSWRTCILAFGFVLKSGCDTLVVLCFKILLVRGGGTVIVTKCVTLASISASNCLLGKKTKRPVKGLERGPYGPKINGNLIKCHLQVFCDNPGGFRKIGPGAEPCAIAHENCSKQTFSRKNIIRIRLARRTTLVVLCLKLWSVRGEGTVRVTKCVILASVWASNCLQGKVTKRPLKGLEHGPYGRKINRNLIKCHL
jgi:hypothetical protein